MRKAFDTILQSEVLATLAAQSGGLEQYRYECVCCGEEVYLAAPFSTKQVAHFRHRNGNNDVECENYLGQFGMLSAELNSRKSNRERAELYFDNTNKVFSIGLRFSENEIRSYEEQGVDFELRARESDIPFRILKINILNFTPEVPTMIPLSIFSYSYYLSNTVNGAKRKYDFFNHNTPTFFKILSNEDAFTAKQVRSMVLYTNTRYFAVFQSQWSVYRVFDGIEISDTFYFDTMGRRFAGIILRICRKTPQVDSLISSWGYQLEASETLTLLWPPATTNGEVSNINADFAFLYASFALHAHGNININSEDIVQFTEGIYRISVKDRIKVFRKNTEALISHATRYLQPYEIINISQETQDEFVVPEDDSFFIFNNSGTTPLWRGQKVFLTRRSKIKRFFSGYLDRIISPQQHHELNGKELLADILIHYKRMEKFYISFFDLKSLSDTALKYVSECNKSGLINSAVKRHILEGKL